MARGKELAKNTAIIAIGRICTQFMSFLLMPLYTTVLSTEEYGIVDLLITYTSLLMPVLLFQVDQALFRFLIDVREDNKKKKEIISTAMVFAAFQVLVTVALFFIVQLFIKNEYKWFLLFNVLASIFSNMMLQLSRGLGDNTGYALGSFISALAQILGNILFLVVFPMGIYGMLIATIVSHLFTAAFIFIKDQVYKFLSIKVFSQRELRSILAYSLPLVPNALCWWALNASDRTIVLLFLGTAANGLLSVGHKFSSVYITIYNIFNLSWTESAALHMNDSDKEPFFSNVITSMFKAFMCMGILIIACMPFLFPVMVNKNFSDAYGLIPVFVLASMLNVVVGLYSVIYVALKKSKEIAKTSLYAGIINIIAHLLLVKWIGLYAAPVSSVIAFGIMAVYRYIDIKKYINIKLDLKWIIVILAMYIESTLVYMYSGTFFKVISLVLMVVLSFMVNWKLISSGVATMIKKRF